MYPIDLNIVAGISDFRLIEDVTKLRELEPKHVCFSDITPNRYGIRTDKAFEWFIASIDKYFLYLDKYFLNSKCSNSRRN